MATLQAHFWVNFDNVEFKIITFESLRILRNKKAIKSNYLQPCERYQIHEICILLIDSKDLIPNVTDI